MADETADALGRAVAQWREMEQRLTGLRRRLESDVVPSYRVGAGEGFALFSDLDREVQALVKESFLALQSALSRDELPT